MEFDNAFRPLAEIFGLDSKLIHIMEDLDKYEIVLKTLPESNLRASVQSRYEACLRERDELCRQ